MVKRGSEVNLEYSKNEIIKKMNAFFGYEVVQTIKLNTFDGFLEKKLKKSTNYATKNKHIKVFEQYFSICFSSFLYFSKSVHRVKPIFRSWAQT